MSTIRFVWHAGPAYPVLGRIPGLGGVARKLEYRLAYRRNCRSREYLYGVAAEAFPEEFHPGAVCEASELKAGQPAAGRWVLLWSDAVGLGWSPVEKQVVQLAAGKPVWVVNGRRRVFEWTPETRREVRWRRFLQKTMLVEWVATVGVLASSPFLYAVDALRGKR